MASRAPLIGILSLFLLPVACGGSSTGTADSAPAARDDGSASPYACATWAAGCHCALRLDGGLEQCSVASLSHDQPPSDQVVCCAAGPSLCTCTHFGCRDYPTQGACVCQSAVAGDGGAVAACPARPGTTCCLERTAASVRCTCSAQACTAKQTVVAACALTDVTQCPTDYTATSACR